MLYLLLLCREIYVLVSTNLGHNFWRELIMYVFVRTLCHKRGKIQGYDHVDVHGWPIQIYAGMQRHNLGRRMVVFLRGILNAWLDVLRERKFRHTPLSKLQFKTVTKIQDYKIKTHWTRVGSFSRMEFYMSSQVTFLRKSTATFGAFKRSIASMYSFVAHLVKKESNT